MSQALETQQEMVVMKLVSAQMHWGLRLHCAGRDEEIQPVAQVGMLPICCWAVARVAPTAKRVRAEARILCGLV
jgi:hypothetical protein